MALVCFHEPVLQPRHNHQFQTFRPFFASIRSLCSVRHQGQNTRFSSKSVTIKSERLRPHKVLALLSSSTVKMCTTLDFTFSTFLYILASSIFFPGPFNPFLWNR